MTYEELKQKLEPHKPKFIVGACFVLVFLVGWGSGSYRKSEKRETVKSQTNYTTSQDKKPQTISPAGAGGEAGATTVTPAAVAGTSTTTNAVVSKPCIVKGNISSASKIYHVKGGAFYDRTNPEQCFDTEAEAIAAGYRKSSR